MQEREAINKPTWGKQVMRYLLIIFGLYLIYCGLLFFLQTKLIFPTDMAGQATASVNPTRGRKILLDTDQGTTHGWYLPAPAASEDSPAPLAVFFHGNAELIDHQSAIVQMYHDMGVSVLLPEYRGYGQSDGTPSQKHIVADALAMLDEVVAFDDVDTDKVILHGRSIGGGMAAQVADQREPIALIIESTFVSVSGFAWRFGVPPVLVRSPLKTGQVFERAAYPILIFHGRQDTIVPVTHGQKLHEIAKDSELVLFDCDHNTLPPAGQHGVYAEAVRRHLAKAGVVEEGSEAFPG